MGYVLLTIFLLDETFPMVSQVTQIEIVCKTYTIKNAMYQLTTLGLKEILEFHLVDSCLGYTIDESMLYVLSTIVLLGVTFPMVYDAR